MDASKQPYPEIEFCSACNEHAVYYWDGNDAVYYWNGVEVEYGKWLSECCAALPVEVDPS